MDKSPFKIINKIYICFYFISFFRKKWYYLYVKKNRLVEQIKVEILTDNIECIKHEKFWSS